MYPASAADRAAARPRPSISPAIRIATVNALDALKEKVAPALGVEAASLVAAGGRIHVKDNPSKGMSWADACKLIGTAADRGRRRLAAGLVVGDDLGRAVRRSQGRHRDRIVKVTRVLAIQDCGLVVSRLTAESQVYGGVVGSLNFALFEDRILDRNTGQMVNPEHGVVPARRACRTFRRSTSG